MVRFFLAAFASLAVFFATACTDSQPAFRATAVTGVDWGKSFVLTSHRNEQFDTAILAGKVQVLFFGFTHCPDICGPTVAKLAQAMKQLGESRGQVQVLFITVDPEHDSPTQMAKFLSAFDESFVGLTGKASDLIAITQDHKIYSKGDGKAIAHSGNLVVKDKTGKVRLIFPEAATVDDLVHDLRLLAKQ